MTRIGIVGDLHGTTLEAEHVIRELGKRKIGYAFALGDFGLWPGFDGVQYLDAVNRVAYENDVKVYVIPGNHDDHDFIDLLPRFAPKHKGFYYVRENVLVSPKVNTFKMFNKTFGIAGGAVSVDRNWREEYNSGKYWDASRGRYIKIKDPTKVWWSQETLSDDEVMEAMSFGKIDYLLTHDASDHTPWKTRLKPDWDSQAHRQKIDGIIESTEPDLHFHGHFHTQYDWGRYINQGHFVQTYGLEADYLAMNRARVTPAAWNWGVLETDTNEFSFRGEHFTFRSLTEEDNDV